MSGHADTIREAFDRLLAQDSWQEPYVKAAGVSLDALLAENQRQQAEIVLLRNLYDELFDQCALIRAERDALLEA